MRLRWWQLRLLIVVDRCAKIIHRGHSFGWVCLYCGTGHYIEEIRKYKGCPMCLGNQSGWKPHVVYP